MSNSKEINVVTIKVMDRELKLKCPKNKITELQEATAYLDKKMREIHHGDKFATIDRIAITAALNIAHELILTKQTAQPSTPNSNKRLLKIKNKLAQTLANTTESV